MLISPSFLIHKIMTPIQSSWVKMFFVHLWCSWATVCHLGAWSEHQRAVSAPKTTLLRMTFLCRKSDDTWFPWTRRPWFCCTSPFDYSSSILSNKARIKLDRVWFYCSHTVHLLHKQTLIWLVHVVLPPRSEWTSEPLFWSISDCGKL